MLTESCRELLTAYVDGELTPRQHKAVLRLLQQSAEARDLLRQMQRDSEALRQLPTPRLEHDLSAPVGQIIADRRVAPGSAPPPLGLPTPPIPPPPPFYPAPPPHS